MELDPALVAKADQQCAQTDENVTRMVAFFREHAAEHGGDVLCAWGKLGRAVLRDTAGHPVMLADLVAGCVDRIAKLEQELRAIDVDLAKLKGRTEAAR